MCQYYNKTLKLPNTRFKFTFVSEDSVLKILKNMDENKAAGLDNLSVFQERISQCAVCTVYKFFSKHSPDYFEELFFPTEETAIRTRSSFQKLKIPRRKTNIGLKSLSYTGPSLWNNLNENLERFSSINDFKHKRVLFRKIKKKT